MTYTVTATNTGSLQLRNLSFSIPTVTDLACLYGSSNASVSTPLTPSTVLELDAVVVCTGTYNFTQDDIEAVPKVVAATATCSTAKGAQTYSSNQVTVTPLNSPAMSVDIQLADCIAPTRARKLEAFTRSCQAAYFCVLCNVAPGACSSCSCAIPVVSPVPMELCR